MVVVAWTGVGLTLAGALAYFANVPGASGLVVAGLATTAVVALVREVLELLGWR